MIIYDANGEVLLELLNGEETKKVDGRIQITCDDNSYRYKAIMGDNELVLKYSLAEHLELPVGAYCTFQSERYTLLRPEDLKMNHSRSFEYTVTLKSDQAKASIWKFRNTVDGRLKFSLTAKPKEHLQMFVDNMNRRDTGWAVGECIDGVETLINYDHAYCIDALQQMADKFETEYEFNGKTVSLKKVEYNKEAPLALSYGKGNGFVSGVRRNSSSEQPPVEFLFVQGGDKNIDPSKYGASELHLPKSVEFVYNGETFVTDDKGLQIYRKGLQFKTYHEDSLDGSSIYPKRVGTVSEVIAVDKDNNFYDFTDDTITESLDYSKYVIAGETMTVIFQSGMLAGRGEFEVKYTHNGKVTKTDSSGNETVTEHHKFEIVPQEIDGVTMPNETFCPKAGDTYIVFHCALPDEYINNADDKSGAEWDLLRLACKYYQEHEDTEFSFKGTLDGIWAKQDWVNIGGKLVLGGYIKFSDERFQKEGVLVRITGLKEYVNKPHSPEIELSNKTVSSGAASRLNQLESEEVAIEESKQDSISFTKRRFRDAKETLSMLQASLLNFSGSVNPITVRTMAMLVGDESLQFIFTASKTSLEPVEHTFTYDTKTKVFSTASGFIRHMTLGIKDISSSHESDYKAWAVDEYKSAVLEDATAKYYLYIKASATVETAAFVLSEQAIAMEQVSGYYHFLVGVLNSEYDGERSFVTLYGFTEILPGRITTDRIVSGNGNSYFDMLANAMKLGSALDFNSKGDGKLRIKGTIVQSLGGDESPLGCFRGTYNSNVTYYNGDVVVYTSNGITSTYKYINETATSGHLPTETTYWQILAQGKQGKTGNYLVSLYAASTSQPTTPTFFWNTQISAQSLWKTAPVSVSGDKKLYMSQAFYNPNTLSYRQWSTPVRISGEQGVTGKDGKDIEFIYLLNNSAEQVSTPTSANEDDYIPTGWTDSPTGVSETKQYEWVSVRVKERGATTWGGFSTPAIWAKWGEQGIDGDCVEYIFKLSATEQTLTAPSSNDTDGYVPTGWTNNPEAVSAQYPYEYVSIRKKVKGHWQAFSTPKLWAYYNVTQFQEYRFAKNGSTSTPPTLDTTAYSPSGWSVEQPTLNKLEYLWMTTAKKDTEGNLVTNWATPVRMTPYDGQNGSSPALVYRGVYDSTKTYYGNANRVDAVKYGDTWYVARTDAGEFSGVVPTDTSKWNAFGGSFESVATDLLLAEMANVGGMIFHNNRLESQVTDSDGNPTVVIDGNLGKIIALSGYIGDWLIQNGGLVNSGENARLSLIHDGGDFLKIEPKSSKTLLALRADGKTGISIYTEDTSGVCISLTAQTGGTGISAYGRNRFISRQGESTLINGLAFLVCNTYTGGVIGTDLVSSVNGRSGFCPNFIITRYLADNTITLPPTSIMADGRCIIIRKAATGNTTLKANTGQTILRKDKWDTHTVTSFQISNGGEHFFVFDAAHAQWIETYF